MRSPSLINRLLASGFVLAGGIAIVLLIWPDGITDLAPDQVTAARSHGRSQRWPQARSA
jgi:hypothetical protein